MNPFIEYERRDYLLSILEHLPACESELLMQKFYDGKTFRELGKSFGRNGQSANLAIKKILVTCRKIAFQLDKGKSVIIEPSMGEKSAFHDGKNTPAQESIAQTMEYFANQQRIDAERAEEARKKRRSEYGRRYYMRTKHKRVRRRAPELKLVGKSVLKESNYLLSLLTKEQKEEIHERVLALFG
jgi:hypothetical protein